MLKDIEKTERGFEIIHFEDYNGTECSLLQSSLAHYEPPGASAIWLGANSERMHLTLDQVKELVILLQNWLNHGTFARKDTP
jgi:hypothetical protein